jgi:hypothetical protein
MVWLVLLAILGLGLLVAVAYPPFVTAMPAIWIRVALYVILVIAILNTI